MNEETFFDQLKNESEQLREMPSPQAWNRLERRLDHKRVQKHKHRFSESRGFLSMAASLALLIGLVGTFMWMGLSDTSSDNTSAAKDTPAQFEDLPIAESTNTDIIAAPATISPQEAQRLIPQKAIVEGSRSENKLIPKTLVKSDKNDGRSSLLMSSEREPVRMSR